jgi:repressor LexA
LLKLQKGGQKKMKIGDRIKAVRKNMGIKQSELAKILSISPSTIGMYEQNRREPDIDTIIRLSKCLGVSVEYLLGFSGKSRAALSEPDHVLLSVTEYLSDEESNKHSSGVKIPVYGKVAAGIPIEAITDIEDYEEISEALAASGEYVALKIHGDSMEPKFSEGDVVIVRLQPTIENGEIAVVMVNGDEATCKKVKRTPEGILLISTNPDYEPMFYSNKQIEQLPIRIYGKVVELRAKF